MKAPLSPNSFWNGLNLVSRCPLCESVFDPLEAKVLGENDQSHLLHIHCRKCGHALLALVVVSRGGISSLGLVTDCTSEDALRFQGSRPIHTDDVIATHELLADGQEFVRVLQE
ncbi:hypothetical protein EPN90_04955 [Patescibacteria group bacterium]|nr:MAG: hypothetical protein EPN90_04955 [Patescibacteria group bacterium]